MLLGQLDSAQLGWHLLHREAVLSKAGTSVRVGRVDLVRVLVRKIVQIVVALVIELASVGS